MAFNITTTIVGYEYRGMTTGKSKTTNMPWMSLIFEDNDANQIQCSVPSELQGDVYSLGLRKGDMCAITIRAVARNDGNSYIQLLALPTILVEEE